MPDVPAEISCETCVAACCRAPKFMPMTQEEFDRHAPKMDLLKVRSPAVYGQRVRVGDSKAVILEDEKDAALTVSVPAGFGLFILQSGCSNLTDDHRCSIYEERPTCCRTFELGSTACLRARRKAGLDADRPISDDEVAEAKAPDARQQLLQEFFSESNAEQSHVAASAPAGVEQPQLFFLPQVRTAVSRETRWILEQLGQCKASDWSRKTRCKGWNVTALAGHLITCLQTAAVVARAAIDCHPAQLPRDFKGDRFAVARAFTAAADDVVVVLDRMSPDALAREVDVDGEGILTPVHVLEVLVVELAVHGLDLAVALGEERHLTPDAIAVSARLLPEFLDATGTPPAQRAYVLRSSAFEVQFGWDGKRWTPDAGPDPCIIEGAPESVLLYALGRNNFDQSALETNRPDEARAFKRYLAGP